MTKQEYSEYVKQVTPTKSLALNMAKAFLIGGIICTIGQFILNALLSMDFSKDDAASILNIILIGGSVILTGLGIYGKLGNFAGAGSLVPITGFANSVASAAIEYKKEGQVFGIGCKIFTIAGPVILYGIVTSWIAGLIYYLINYVF